MKREHGQLQCHQGFKVTHRLRLCSYSSQNITAQIFGKTTFVYDMNMYETYIWIGGHKVLKEKVSLKFLATIETFIFQKQNLKTHIFDKNDCGYMKC